jgi:hypothetical protein
MKHLVILSYIRGKIMPSLSMEGPYRFNIKTINEKVTRVSPGNYVLGRRNEHGTFLFSYIGRANTDLNSKLKSRAAKMDKPFFKFRYSDSAQEAFRIECENYHDYVKDGKNKHPKRPADTDWKCPRCKIFK